MSRTALDGFPLGDAETVWHILILILSGIEPGILRIRGLLVLKNLFSSITSGLRAFLCPSGKKFLSGFPVWMGFIR